MLLSSGGDVRHYRSGAALRGTRGRSFTLGWGYGLFDRRCLSGGSQSLLVRYAIAGAVKCLISCCLWSRMALNRPVYDE